MLLARSALFAEARRLVECNRQDWNYPLTKRQKLIVGLYMILQDHGEGRFPPRYEDESATHEAEIAYYESIESLGKTPEQIVVGEMRKPFWHGPACARYLRDYGYIQPALHGRGLGPPASVLEVGCGSGWVAEFLAASGFHVLATTLNGADARLVQLRRESLEKKGLAANIAFRRSPMERIDEAVRDLPPFDAVFVYEALHHAHDWRRAIQAFYRVLAPNGWCFIFGEPNLLHTLVSYRVGRLSNTHEIGMSSARIRREMRRVGFTKVETLRNRLHFWAMPIWISAQKPPET